MFENEQRMLEVNIELETNEHILASGVIVQELQLANWKSNFFVQNGCEGKFETWCDHNQYFLIWVCRESKTMALSEEASVTSAKGKPFSKLVFDV